MSVITTPSRGKSWLFQVTALCVVLGMLLALSLKTQKQVMSEGGGPTRWPALRAEFFNLKSQNIKLQQDLADYKTRYEKLMNEQASSMSGANSLKQALEEMKMLAGTVAVRGRGVIVTLVDSPKRDIAETRKEVIEDYIVHDYDLRGVVNELFAAGAEAISINNQRLVATSSIRCVGPVILVNVVQVSPPYVIKAIGDPEVLSKALELPGGVADVLLMLDMITIKKSDNIVVPAYEGSIRFNEAKPVQEKSEKKKRN